MPRFTVLQQRDAWVNYEAQIEAETAEQAAKKAADSYELVWVRTGEINEYDHREIYTLDEDGVPIESTKVELY